MTLVRFISYVFAQCQLNMSGFRVEGKYCKALSEEFLKKKPYHEHDEATPSNIERQFSGSDLVIQILRLIRTY